MRERVRNGLCPRSASSYDQGMMTACLEPPLELIQAGNTPTSYTL